MKEGTVEKVLTPVRQAACLEGLPLVQVATEEGVLVALDQTGAREADRVLLVTGQAAQRWCLQAPVDAAVVAVLPKGANAPALPGNQGENAGNGC